MMRLLLIISIVLLLTGCFAPSNDDLTQFIADAKANESVPPEAIPEVPVIEIYAYSSAEQGLRSPFIDAVEVIQQDIYDSGVRPDLDRPKEELEVFPLDSLRMVGTLAQNGQVFGLINTKEGTVYRVRIGDHMGKQYGRITGIFQDRIELIEIVPDRQGGYIERPASVALGN
jgi:type IV pilus assembly protein PilP